MESPDERPELKRDFRHANLRDYVRVNRGRLLSAALTILRAYLIAGSPSRNLNPWGSFEGWSSLVRGAVVFAGLADPGETREELQSCADRDAAAMRAILDSFQQLDPDRHGITAAKIIKRLKETDSPPAWMEELRSAVEELCGKLDSRSLGYKFRHFARRNFGGAMLDAARMENTPIAGRCGPWPPVFGDPPRVVMVDMVGMFPPVKFLASSLVGVVMVDMVGMIPVVEHPKNLTQTQIPIRRIFAAYFDMC